MQIDATAPFELLDRDYRGEAPDPGEVDQWEPGLLDRFLSWQAELVDRAALRVMERAFMSVDDPDLDRVDEAFEEMSRTYARAELFDQPDIFFRRPDQPDEIRTRHLGRLDDGVRSRVSFPSPYEPYSDQARGEYAAFRRNRTCEATLWKHYGSTRGTILCLHYWCGGQLPLVEWAFGAPSLYRAGFDVAFMTLPFHGRRTPRRAAFSGQYFPSRDLRRTNEAFGQSVADARLLSSWLIDHGCDEPLGLIGISLGGYTSALLAGLDERYRFVVPIITPASFADIIWWHGANHPVQQRAIAAGASLERMRQVWSIHSPLSHQLKVSRDNVLILAAARDAVVRPVQTLALWRHWGEPEIRWFGGSHMTNVGRLDYMDTLLDWLDERF